MLEQLRIALSRTSRDCLVHLNWIKWAQFPSDSKAQLVEWQTVVPEVQVPLESTALLLTLPVFENHEILSSCFSEDYSEIVNCVYELFELFEASKYSKNLPSLTPMLNLNPCTVQLTSLQSYVVLRTLKCSRNVTGSRLSIFPFNHWAICSNFWSLVSRSKHW